MSLYTLGLNHQTAPLDVRERIAFSPDALGHALRDLLARPKVKEAAILSTCNRTEVYVPRGGAAAGGALARGVPPRPEDSLAPYLYTLPREKASRTRSASRAASTRWCWASRRSWAR